MKRVYDDDTQKHIDFLENRKVEIMQEIEKDMNTATGMSRFESYRMMHPGWHPLYDNQEYIAIHKELTQIYTCAVPKIWMTREEHEEYCHGR